MKIKLLIMTTALIFAAAICCEAQTKDFLHTPKTGSAERQAILDGLRRGDTNMTFNVDYLKVHNGWAWIDATPLDARTKRATAEGGASLMRLDGNKWKVVDLSIVLEDPDDPMGADDLSKVFLANIRKTFPGAPLDIFPKPRF